MCLSAIKTDLSDPEHARREYNIMPKWRIKQQVQKRKGKNKQVKRKEEKNLQKDLESLK